MWKLLLLALLANSLVLSLGCDCSGESSCNCYSVCDSNEDNSNCDYSRESGQDNDCDSNESNENDCAGNDMEEDNDCEENNNKNENDCENNYCDSQGNCNGQVDCANALARFNVAVLNISTKMLKVQRELYPDETFCISPLTIIYLAAGLGLFSYGQTQAEIFNFLNLRSNEEITCVLRTINQRIANLPSGVEYYQATNYFAGKRNTFTPRFSEDVLIGVAVNLNFLRPAQTERSINRITASQTNNKVTDVIDDRSIFNSTTGLVTISATYFRSIWEIEFEVSKTVTEFNVAPGCTVPGRFLTQTGIYNYTDCNELNSKVIQLNFKERSFQVIIILPNVPFTENIVLNKMANNPTGWLYNVQRQFKPTTVEVTIPVYNQPTFYDSRATSVRTFSPSTLFDRERIQLDGVFEGNERVSVDAARQKNIIQVPREGVRPSVPLGRYGNTETFISNYPSLFAVCLGDTVVYVGQVVKPTEGQFECFDSM